MTHRHRPADGPHPLVSPNASRRLRIAFWAAALFSLVMALMPHPPQLPGAPNDKIQHIAAFAMLTALASPGWPKTPAWRLFVGLSAFGALIEVLQAIPALHRDSDILDWAADSFAAAFVLAALRWRAGRRE